MLLKDNDIETHIGVIITMLLYTFTLITGLKNLEPEERFTKLYQLLLIVFAIMPNYYHTSVNRLFGLLHIPRGYRYLPCHSVIIDYTILTTHVNEKAY